MLVLMLIVDNVVNIVVVVYNSSKLHQFEICTQAKALYNQMKKKNMYKNWGKAVRMRVRKGNENKLKIEHGSK